LVEQVEVDASGRPGPDEIRSMSGILPGMNLLSLSTADVSRRLEAHPWIRNATVVKRMPDRILIKVQKRRPAAIVEIQGGLFYMGGEGRILDKIRPGEPRDLPLLTGLAHGLREAPCRGHGRDVQQALDLLRAVQAAPALGSLSEIHVDRSEGLSFVLEGFPLPVQVGWSGFPVKMIRFEKILSFLAPQSNAIERVDLRFSDQIVVRYRAGGKPRILRGERTEAWAGSDSSLDTT
jgi:cell division protein FtsQ